MSVLTLRPGRENKVHLLLDGDYAMTVDRDFVAFTGLYENMELDDEALTSLQREVNARRAFNKASDLLSRRDHSEKELREKLRQKGFSEGADEAIERLRGYGYVDDARFAARYAAELQRVKHYGKKRIEQELFRKGVDRAVIAETLEGLTFDADDLVSLIERKYAGRLGTEKGVSQTVAALQRRGYGYREIKDALEQLAQKTEEEA
ncbi:MAG: regulatory protein RecX [Clostridia bacterium]|jgi:regulatory protein|nr:regulatory protein RecX [Clostridia bacterium]